MFYVYEWYIKDTNEIFYVGKGIGKRYKVTKGRNSQFNKMLEKYDCDSRIIKWFQNEKDAFEYEAQRIDELKAIEMCKCNIHPGGAGGSSEHWTDELRKSYSINNVMKRPEQRERMSIDNPMKNPEVAEKVAEYHRRKVIINGIEYESVKQAQEHYNVPYDTISSWCKRGINYYGEQCRFADEEQIIFTDKRYNKGSSKAIIYKGKTYESEIDFCNDIGIGYRTGSEWLKRGFDPKGQPCRFVGDERKLVFENRHVTRNQNRAKPVIVNGIKYKSCKEASEKLNIPKPTLYSYLQGKRKNPNYICVYDNQQPS